MQHSTEVKTAVFDLAVIGSGPGGHEAALRAAKAGMKVCLIEKGALGGVCVNWGCIPTKALLRSAEVLELCSRAGTFGIIAASPVFDLGAAVKRSRNVVSKLSKGISFTLGRAGVEIIQGEAVFRSPREVAVIRDGELAVSVHAEQTIIAAGGRLRELPGLEPDGERVITSKEALALKAVPSSMIILGGGAVGVEMAWFYAKAGSAVTLVEMMPRLLPLEDEEISLVLQRSFEKAGIRVLTGAKLGNVSRKVDGVSADVVAEGHEPQTVTAELLLVAVGVTGNTERLGLDLAGVEISRGFIVTDGFCRTSADNIFAIGDVRGGMLLAHKASAEAAIAVKALCGSTPEPLDEALIPRCVYAEPSVSSIGFTEKEAGEKGFSVMAGRSMFAASGKANAYGSLEGLVKLVFNSGDGRLLGAHVVGHGSVELIGELTLAMTLGVTAMQLSSTVHAHPTLSETIREAAENALGH
ncbi:MAG: dihydrolipoyl dehydrogenase [Chlorobiaceae bacterium]|nr:dihydrolipoyl dehydrogenase [Chlorobiaceae bacterium]NTV61121.1 dihydrolipoyl dehydrogenase [Chlorobiaceae bacterium]